MDSTKTRGYIFLATSIFFCHPETCGPLATKIFPWRYQHTGKLYSIYWKFSNDGSTFDNIMYRLGDETSAIPVNGTQFYGRIGEYPETNAGMEIRLLEVNDTGIFKVTVTFTDLFVEEYDLQLIVSYASGE